MLAGFAFIDITCGDGATEDGYRVTSQGMNKREPTETNVALLYEGTDQGKSIYFEHPEHALTICASLKDLDPSTITTSVKGPFRRLKVLNPAVIVEALLCNGAHRRELMMSFKIRSLTKRLSLTKLQRNKEEEGSPQHVLSTKAIKDLEREIDSLSFWLVKIYDIGKRLTTLPPVLLSHL